MQRLFSTFPAGLPGVGLLLVRAVVGFALLIQGAVYLNDWKNLTFDRSVAVGLTLSVGICLLAGILTPVASVLVVIGTLASALSLMPTPMMNLFDSRLGIIDVIALATAIAFLGPGAFSLDARLFGRRQIFIPNTSHSRKF